MRALVAVPVAIFVALIPGLVGCGGSSSAPDASTELPFTGPCTGAAYDPCTTNDQCQSGNCKLYNQSNFTVCTAPCTAGDDATCPLQNNAATATCNNMGLCKPAAPNNCTR